MIVPPAHRYDPGYMTYLVNPVHPDFEQVIEIGPVLELDVDPQLVE